MIISSVLSNRQPTRRIQHAQPRVSQPLPACPEQTLECISVAPARQRYPADQQLISMSIIIVDAVVDGPISAEFSIVCFGAVLFDEQLDKTFYGQTRPISERFDPEALAISGFSREQHLTFEDPKSVMESFAVWLETHSKGRPVFVSDNV